MLAGTENFLEEGDSETNEEMPGQPNEGGDHVDSPAVDDGESDHLLPEWEAPAPASGGDLVELEGGDSEPAPDDDGAAEPVPISAEDEPAADEYEGDENMDMEEEEDSKENITNPEEEDQEPTDFEGHLEQGFPEGPEGQSEGFYDPEGQGDESQSQDELPGDEELSGEGDQEEPEPADEPMEAEPEDDDHEPLKELDEIKEEDEGIGYPEGAEDSGEPPADPLLSPKPESDAAPIDSCPLTTLASAALAAGGVTPEDEKPSIKKEAEQWFRVGTFNGTLTTVSSYILTAEEMNDEITRVNLEPGTAYKFRVAAVNSVGQSDWSEIAAFKTSLPGYPGAPSAIKISRSAEGAHLTWQPPSIGTGEIIEYSVYLAVSSAPAANHVQSAATQLSFVRVYCGGPPLCVVNNSTLTSAHIDSTSKPAIIFRIAARNSKGYGPATQVRWLQEPTAPAPTAVKRPIGSMDGATPSKILKAHNSEW